jgi:hypothetical protein
MLKMENIWKAMTAIIAMTITIANRDDAKL